MTDAARARWLDRGAWMIVIAGCALAAWRRWVFLAESPYPLGIDGFFYAGQLRSILEHGHLAWPASPLAFWAMAPLAALTDPIVGAKLGAAIGGAAAGLPAYALGKRLGGDRGAGLIAAAIVTTSAGSFYLSIEFVKQGVGLTVGLAYLVALVRALERPTRARLAIAIAALVATALTHKFAAGLAIAVSIPALAVELRARGQLDRARLIVIAIIAGGVAALAIAVGALFPERFLALRDLDLLAQLFGREARWDAPALALPHHSLAMGYEAAIAGGLALAAVALALTRYLEAFRVPLAAARPAERALALGFAGLALVIALPWLDVGDPQGLAFRLRLAAFVPLALVAAALGGDLATLAPQAWRLPGLATLAAAILLVQPARREEGVVRAHPAMVAAVRALDGIVPTGDTVIVSERHIAFMAAWFARVPTALDPSTVPAAHRWRLMPLAFVGNGSPLDRALLAARAQPTLVPPRGLHPRHPDGLVLVPEATWEWVLAQLPPKARAYYRAWHTI
ncbi:MAG: glycosyltransferase family 39 protein [Deltaproteobacteria bacterium]|nr:glycosyltransferase family 39 protein [Deltaproteobacteria bacterium]